MGAGPDHELLPSPRDFFLGRKRCVAELFAELFGRSFLPFPHFAVVNHHITRVVTKRALLMLVTVWWNQLRWHQCCSGLPAIIPLTTRCWNRPVGGDDAHDCVSR